MRGPTTESGVTDEEEGCQRPEAAGLDTNGSGDHRESVQDTVRVKYEVEYCDREEGGQNSHVF